MSFIEGVGRNQQTLFPEVLDEYVPPDHPIRFIDAYVDQLDLAALRFDRAEPAETGRPGYDPADLLKLYMYGYLNGICSSRKLERETLRNVELMWLIRRLRPDFKTIADFRRRNRTALPGLFREFTMLCKRLDLFGAELVAIDGSKFRAVNSKKRNYSRPMVEEDPSCGGRADHALSGSNRDGGSKRRAADKRNKRQSRRADETENASSRGAGDARGVGRDGRVADLADRSR
jgi:transposase